MTEFEKFRDECELAAITKELRERAMDLRNPLFISEYSWEDLFAYTFDPGGMEGDITLTTNAPEDVVRLLWKEWREGDSDTNFAGFVESRGYAALDAQTVKVRLS